MENENFNKKILYVTVLVIITLFVLYYNKNSQSTYSEKICPTCPPQEPCTCPPEKICPTCPPEKICPTPISAEAIKGFSISTYKPAIGPGIRPSDLAVPDSITTVNNINDCANLCSSDSSLNMFHYTPSTGVCKLYKIGSYSYGTGYPTEPESIAMSKFNW